MTENHSYGSTKLGASLPEEGSKAGFRNIAFLKKLQDGLSTKKGELFRELFYCIVSFYKDFSQIPTAL